MISLSGTYRSQTIAYRVFVLQKTTADLGVSGDLNRTTNTFVSTLTEFARATIALPMKA